MSTAGPSNDPATVETVERFQRIATACTHGDLATVRDELKSRGDPVLHRDRSTLIHLAVIGGNPDVLTLLIDLGADLQATTDEDIRGLKGSKSPLDAARIMGQKKAIAVLEDACEAAHLNGETYTVKALRYPDGGLFVGVYNTYTGDRVHRGLAERTRKRAEQGEVVPVESGDLDGIGAIVAAVETGDTPHLEQAIHAYPEGQQIDVGGGNTVLHLAAMSGNTENVVLLLKKGADPFLRNDRGQRAIDVVPDLDQRHVGPLLALAMGEDRPYFVGDDGTVNERQKELFHRRATSHGVPLDAIAALKAKHEAEERGGS